MIGFEQVEPFRAAQLLDVAHAVVCIARTLHGPAGHHARNQCVEIGRQREFQPILCLDRKSTRLNSSHVKISYAVFCLKKKKKTNIYKKRQVKRATQKNAS